MISNKWAFTKGNTTKEEVGYTRGLGLNEIETFIKLNKGKINVYSHDGCAIINPDTRIFGNMLPKFYGTIIIIEIAADSNHIYIMNNE